MRIRTFNIPQSGGLDVNFVVSPQVLQQTWAKDGSPIDIFSHPVQCHVHLELSHQDVLLTGKTDSTLSPVCGRCGEVFEMPFHVDLNLTCSPQPKNEVGTDSYQESEEGLVFFRKEELDLTEIVREQVLLALPMNFLCKDTCQGLCPHCGANLNQGPHQCKKEVIQAREEG